MNLLLSVLISTVSILITAYLVPGISVKNFWAALVLSVVLGFLNFTLRPILLLLTLPVNILTLGLFTFVVNAVIILVAGSLVPGFGVDSFLAALIFSLVLSIVNSVISAVIK